MFSIPHLILIFVIALIAFGPEKLPQLARTLGKAMAEFRKVTGDLRRVVDDEMREIERATREAEIRKRDAAAQQALPGATSETSTSVAPPLPDEHVISPREPAVPSSAPPGTITAEPPNGRGASAEQEGVGANRTESSEPSDRTPAEQPFHDAQS